MMMSLLAFSTGLSCPLKKAWKGYRNARAQGDVKEWKRYIRAIDSQARKLSLEPDLPPVIKKHKR